jgi:DNA primase large subunit
VEEVNARFRLAVHKHPIEEFKRLQQVSTVEEYIKKFGRMKARLLHYDSHLNEEFFIQGFISCLKEEIRHLVEFLNPRRLNEMFNFAYKIELSIEGRQKR